MRGVSMTKSESNRRKTAAFCFAVMLMVSVASHGGEQPAEQYECTSEASTGFGFDPVRRKWIRKHFDTNSKWLIQTDKVSKEVVVFQAGKSVPYFRCEKRPPTAPLFNCTGFGEFTFNFTNGRFVVRGFHSYLTPDFRGEKEGDSDEWMEIGHCRPL
jgi:hypothetical protein